MGAAHFIPGFADQIQQITRAFEVHGDAGFDVIDLAEGGDQQSGGDRDGAASTRAVLVAEFIIEAVFATDEGCSISNRDVLTGDGGAHERAEGFRAFGVAPAEIVEDRDAVRVGSDGDAVSDGFVDR